ncbi:MAG: AIR synthase related protein [Methylocystis sp.]
MGFLLALALPGDWTNDWLDAFAAGLAEDARAFAAPLIGGDTGATPGPLTISITALGRAQRFVPRSGAKPGDAIFVSGPIGDAALGLAVRRDPALAARLSPEARDYLIGRYLLPRPRLDLAGWLAANASAAMDISDGLAGDLAKLCGASGASAVVDVSNAFRCPPPRARLSRSTPRCSDAAITGGDDYEILIACERRAASRARAPHRRDRRGTSSAYFSRRTQKARLFQKIVLPTLLRNTGSRSIAARPRFWQKARRKVAVPADSLGGAATLFSLRDIRSPRRDQFGHSSVEERKGEVKMVLFLTIVFGLMSIVYGVKTYRNCWRPIRFGADAGNFRAPSPKARRLYLNRQYRTIAMVGGVIFVILVVLLGWAVSDSCWAPCSRARPAISA